jgi:predicted anti-sigma-YlaC factor YlaD
MSEHVPKDLLLAFVEGDIEEQVAIHIASHLDDCPKCSAMAVRMDPLASAFASVSDPVPPSDLADHIIMALEQPEASSYIEFVIGGSLLAAAALLSVLVGDPVASAVDVGVFVNALGTAGQHLANGLLSSSVALSFSCLLALLGSLATVRSMSPQQRLP